MLTFFTSAGMEWRTGSSRDSLQRTTAVSLNEEGVLNSGSAMFNAKGELLGLAFDGNWEAMSSDILYEPKMQRTIGVDVRYILFMIEKYGKAGNLIQELKLANP